jgi:hypothetical protein
MFHSAFVIWLATWLSITAALMAPALPSLPGDLTATAKVVVTTR